MKATKTERGNIRNRVVDNSALTILGLQIVLGCVYLNSYLDIVTILPSAIYFSPIKSTILISLLFINLAFLIMSIGYNSICFFYDNSIKFKENGRTKVVLKSNEYRIQRSQIFLFNCFLILFISALLLMNITGIIESSQL